MGFGPQVVDLDGDGTRDVLSGSFPGHLLLFRGTPGGFRPAEQLRDRAGRAIRLGTAAAVFAGDWDRDGDLDLVVGDQKGRVWFVPGDGGAERLAFGPATGLADTAGQPVRVRSMAGPVLADWDRDGTLDLVLGAGDGTVRWFANGAARGAPALAPPVGLVPKAATLDGSAPAKRTKPCVVDWNGDGLPDLLVGDCSLEAPPPRPLSETEAARLADLEARILALGRAEAPVEADLARQVFARMELTAPAEADRAAFLASLTETRRREFANRLRTAKARAPRWQVLKAARAETTAEIRVLRPPPAFQGSVWLYLRRAPAARR